MAPKPLAGVQRVTYAKVRAEAKSSAIALKHHRGGCYDCAKARQDPYRYCDEGWELAKADSRAQAALRRWKESQAKGQGALF